MAKTVPKITDISEPGDTPALASSRPIITTDHDAISRDPMMTPEFENATSKPTGAPLVAHTSKTITPPSTVATLTTEPKPAEPTAEAESESTDSSETDAPASEDEKANAAQAEADAARLAREQELEQLIANGTYTVPINAVQRQRSRMFVAGMCVLAVVLALFLLDISLDANIFSLPFTVPHTHFFTSS